MKKGRWFAKLQF